MPAPGDDAPLAKLFPVKHTEVFLLGVQVRLVTPQDTIVEVSNGFTAVLNSGIIPLEFYLTGECKVFYFSALPNQKSIPFGWLVLGGFSNDGSIFHFPKFRLTHPSAQVFAVEKIQSFPGMGGRGPDGREAERY